MKVLASLVSLRTAAAAAVVVVSSAVIMPSFAAPAETPDLGEATVVSADLVTLELHFPAPASTGKFDVQGARIVDATVWGDALKSRADASGFSIAEKQGPAAQKAKAAGKKKAGGKKKQGPRQQQGVNGASVLVTLQGQADAVLEVDSNQGKASIALKEVGFDRPKTYLDGALVARRLPAAAAFAVSPTENDYPAAARGADGTVWVAFVAYRHGGDPNLEEAAKGDFRSLVPQGNGDQIRLCRYDGQQWSAAMPVTEGFSDVWKATVAVDGAGKVWVAWSQNSGGNWDIYRRSYDPAAAQWTAIERVTSEPGSDVNVVSTTDASGKVWWAWQGRREKFFQIFLLGSAGGQPIAVTNNAANHWDPAIAADSKGNVYVAWDSYENKNYDVFLRSFKEGKAEPTVPIATTPGFEARPSLAVDRADRVWIGYELGGPNWGKDFGKVVPAAGAVLNKAKGKAKTAPLYDPATGRLAAGGDGEGIPLYSDRTVVVKCYAEGRLWRLAADPGVVLNAMPRPKSFARVAVADDGRLWLLFRRHPLKSGVGETWAEYAMPFDGRAWGDPCMLPDSDNLLDNRPALLPLGQKGVLAVFSSDQRLRGADNNGHGSKLLKNDLYAALLQTTGEVVAPQLVADAADAAPVRPVHLRESEDVQRLRDVRVQSAGNTYQLARGEFHRHTEYTAHHDGDGSLEDMWRYSQDAADMDWLGNADHDNGFGQQYSWWTIQKTMDIYHNPPWFVAPFTYERSVNYPNGHRNVIFAQRGIRTLPRGDMTGSQESGTPDTKMLYAYLKHFGGICASHTSATGMGTDWRDNDPLVEPIVEIYQGDRNNYECEGAPRSFLPAELAPADPNGGEAAHPKGFIWNAFAKGYRFGFESSSDHVSTHSSYGIALVKQPGREGLLEAFKARRCYAATDNILLIVKCQEHLMGQEFTAADKPTLEIHAVGTGPIAKLTIVRNNQYVYSATPNQAVVDTTWTDAEPPTAAPGYYYVRIEQADANLAWSSPMWIHYRPQ